MTKLIAPTTARITQGWGANPAFYEQFGQKGHTGIDYGMQAGDSVKAAAAGMVVFAGHGSDHSGLLDIAGNAIIVDHGDIITTYSHLSKHGVKRGQRVKQGQELGKSGATGVVSGPHLHFEVWPVPTNWNNGYSGRVNPNKYLVKEDEMYKGKTAEQWYRESEKWREAAIHNRRGWDAAKSLYAKARKLLSGKRAGE